MTPTPSQRSGGWIAFLPVDLAMKAFMGMGTLALVQSCTTLTKTLRDVHEGTKLAHRLDEARTEALLKEAGRG